MKPTFEEAIAELARSPRFQAWGKLTITDLEESNVDVMEKHFTPQELAKAWGASVQTIRQIFEREEGVLKIGRSGTRTRRRYFTLRIPESVAERVHTRLSA
jgi:hypothetical protein